MAHVRTIEPAEAEGEVLAAYQTMTGQSSPARVANVMKSSSIRPRTMVVDGEPRQHRELPQRRLRRVTPATRDDRRGRIRV